MRKYLILLILLQFCFSSLVAQEEANQDSSKVSVFFDDLVYKLYKQQQDSNYIENYSDEISLRIVGVGKYNFLRLVDQNQNTMVRYRPDPRLNLGLGVTYRWFSIDFTIGLGISPNPDEFETSEVFDFQGSIFTNKHFLEVAYKYYLGHFINETKGLSTQLNDSSRFRADVRSQMVNLEYLYALGYQKFSFKAPFVNNEMQKKSAGSVILGANFTVNSYVGDRSVIPEEVEDQFNPVLGWNQYNLASLSINAGYMYSLVIKKHFYITLGLIPGLAFNAGDFSLDNKIEPFGILVSPRLKTMNAIGYNKRKFYAGITIQSAWNFTWLDKKALVETGTGKGKIFIGYRIKGKAPD